MEGLDNFIRRKIKLIRRQLDFPMPVFSADGKGEYTKTLVSIRAATAAEAARDIVSAVGIAGLV